MFDLFGTLWERKVSERRKQTRERLRDWRLEGDYPYMWSYTYMPDVDTMYTCPNCKKKIGLEGRFIFEKMGFDCPYCSSPMVISLKTKGEEDEEDKPARDDIPDSGETESRDEEDNGETTQSTGDVS